MPRTGFAVDIVLAAPGEAGIELGKGEGLPIDQHWRIDGPDLGKHKQDAILFPAIWEALEVDLESQQGQPTVDIGVLGSRETCQKVGIGAREVVLNNDPMLQGGS